MNGDERAVSEVIAYVIILGIVFTVFGLIFFNATSIFSAAGDNERLANGERSFKILQTNTETVVFGGAPRHTTDVPLGGGSVSVVGEQVRVVLDVNGTEVRNRTLSPVRYRLDDTSLSYENGAVIRTSTTGSAMASDPGWVVREDAVSIPGVTTFGSGSIGGGGTAAVQMEAAGRTFTQAVSSGDTGNVSIEVFSERSSAWAQYMEGLNETTTVVDVNENPSQNRVEMEMEIDLGQTFVYVERPVRVRVR